MRKILVLIEKTDNGFNAYAPDLPGCVAAGDTIEETELLMAQAVEMHLEDMAATGQEVPPQTHVAAEFLLASAG
jgi:predicted RNase H-like HicB family nuclease